jgi:hypothetical protein
MNKQAEPQPDEADAVEMIMAVRQLLQKGERSAAVVLYAREKGTSVSVATAVIDELIQQIRNKNLYPPPTGEIIP